MSKRSPWLSIRKPLEPRRALAMKVMAFGLPLLVWSIVSYVPWVWHPMVMITDSGGSSYRVGNRLARQDFEDLNVSLRRLERFWLDQVRYRL